jgi:hypothetical protein
MMKSIVHTSRIDLWFIYWCFILLAVGCRAEVSSPTPTPIYAHYVPPSNAPIRLAFDYPSLWTWKQIDGRLILVIDPLVPTLPVGYEEDVEVGAISILLEKINITNDSLDSETAAEIQFMANWYPNELVSDQEIDIDGYPARRLIFRAEPHTGFGNQDYLLLEKILFIVDSECYRIDFHIAESNRHGPFGAGYDTMIDSLQIVP